MATNYRTGRSTALRRHVHAINRHRTIRGETIDRFALSSVGLRPPELRANKHTSYKQAPDTSIEPNTLTVLLRRYTKKSENIFVTAGSSCVPGSACFPRSPHVSRRFRAHSKSR